MASCVCVCVCVCVWVWVCASERVRVRVREKDTAQLGRRRLERTSSNSTAVMRSISIGVP
jgi:hypothetical protein